METKKKKLIVFTRYPEPGRTKTRLIPVLGEIGAADLQRQMTEKILGTARQLMETRGVSVDVYFCGGDAELMQRWLGERFAYRQQVDGGLDRRMQKAFEDAFCRPSDAVVIVGSDIPGINTDLLSKAFGALADHDLVLGPAHDGGYYLIGLNRRSHRRGLPRLFDHIDWGSDNVLAQTLRTAAAIGMAVFQLPLLADVDRPQDLNVWRKCRDL